MSFQKSRNRIIEWHPKNPTLTREISVIAKGPLYGLYVAQNSVVSPSWDGRSNMRCHTTVPTDLDAVLRVIQRTSWAALMVTRSEWAGSTRVRGGDVRSRWNLAERRTTETKKAEAHQLMRHHFSDRAGSSCPIGVGGIHLGIYGVVTCRRLRPSRAYREHRLYCMAYQTRGEAYLRSSRKKTKENREGRE